MSKRQGPIWDENGVLDSDLLLKWGCALIGLLGVLLSIIGHPLGWYGPSAPPPSEYLWIALGVALGFGGVFVAKSKRPGMPIGDALALPPPVPDTGPAGTQYPEDD